MKTIDEMLNLFLSASVVFFLWLGSHAVTATKTTSIVRVGDHLEWGHQWGVSFTPLKIIDALDSIPPLAGNEVGYLIGGAVALLVYSLFRLGLSLAK